jgi:hypothetical protein
MEDLWTRLANVNDLSLDLREKDRELQIHKYDSSHYKDKVAKL